jgi:hypothetical protein
MQVAVPASPAGFLTASAATPDDPVVIYVLMEGIRALVRRLHTPGDCQESMDPANMGGPFDEEQAGPELVASRTASGGRRRCLS